MPRPLQKPQPLKRAKKQLLNKQLHTVNDVGLRVNDAGAKHV